MGTDEGRLRYIKYCNNTLKNLISLLPIYTVVGGWCGLQFLVNFLIRVSGLDCHLTWSWLPTIMVLNLLACWDLSILPAPDKVRLIGDFKLGVKGFMSLCVGPVIDCQPVQSVPCLSSQLTRGRVLAPAGTGSSTPAFPIKGKAAMDVGYIQ